MRKKKKTFADASLSYASLEKIFIKVQVVTTLYFVSVLK